VDQMVLTREYTGAGSCPGTVPGGWSLNLSFGQLSLSGSPGNFSFRFESSALPNTNPQATITATFSGGLADGVITGSVTVADNVVFANGATRSGTVVVPIRLDVKD